MKTCGILTISDTSSQNPILDKSSSIIREKINELEHVKVTTEIIIPDEKEQIVNALKKWINEKVNLIITTGGTGFSKRDVTPEATLDVVEKLASGISQAIFEESYKFTKYAMLSRGIAGISNESLIINLPGSPKAVKECLPIIVPILSHALDQICGNLTIVKCLHSKMQGLIIKSNVTTTHEDIFNRPRESPYEVISMEQAECLVFKNVPVLSIEHVNTIDSLNKVLANIIRAQLKVPPYHASIKDGYAVRYEDGIGKRLVINAINAGDNQNSDIIVVPGSCARISTGARIPSGADSVVQVEDTRLIRDTNSSHEKEIEIFVPPSRIGQDIRTIGTDINGLDTVILDNTRLGTLINSADLATVCMAGVKTIECYQVPIVGVLSTGNELMSIENKPDDLLEVIIDCNRPLLLNLYRENHFQVLDLGIVKDEPQAILDVLVNALKTCDMIVTTGGVSMGEKDFLKLVLEKDLKAEIHFGRVWMKPGKPTTFATVCNELTNEKIIPIFSLPGNPVSAFVTSHLFVLPALRKMSGLSNYVNKFNHASLMHDINLDPRPDYRRACLLISHTIDSDNNEYTHQVSCKQLGNQLSSRLPSCVGANVLLKLPAATSTINSLPAGSIISYMNI